MAVNKGLGRGLSDLLGGGSLTDYSQGNTQDEVLSSNKVSNSGAIELPIADVDANLEQPRKHFDQEALQELSESIRVHGVIQPIVVTRVGLRFMVIAGERRLRASKLAGKNTIPAIIRNYTKQQIREISLIENLQREDLNPVEEAKAIKQLMEEFNLTQEQAGDRIGKSRSAVANILRLLTLNEEVVALIEADRLSPGHARTLVVVPNKVDQLNLAMKGCDNKLSVRQMEKLVQDFLTPKQEIVKKDESSCLELKQLVLNMQRTFATKVSAMGNERKGRICIDYFTKDDLDRLSELVEEWISKQ